MLDRGCVVDSGLAPKTAMGVQVTLRQDNRHVIGSRAPRFVEGGLGRIPLLPSHEVLGAGRGIGTKEDRIEPWIGPGLRWASQLHQSFTTFAPGRVVENLY